MKIACPHCKNTGRIFKAMEFPNYVRCPHCNGEGYKGDGSDSCPRCGTVHIAAPRHLVCGICGSTLYQ